jgi:hypothetical protein
MNYGNAWKCAECPEKNDEQGCPAWMELVETNDKGEVRINKTCLLAYFPQLVMQLIKAANRPAAAVESCRNEIVLGFGVVAAALREKRPHGHVLPQGPNRQPITLIEGEQDALETE